MNLETTLNFVLRIESLISGSIKSIPIETLQQDLHDLENYLEDLGNPEQGGFIKNLRTLYRMDIELRALQEKMYNLEFVHIHEINNYVNKALLLIKTEIQLMHLRINHPSLNEPC